MDKAVKNVFEVTMNADGLKLGIVCARFNELLTSNLLNGAIDAFVRHGGKADDISVAWVPGSYETPLIAKKMATSGKFSAVIAPANAALSGISARHLIFALRIFIPNYWTALYRVCMKNKTRRWQETLHAHGKITAN